MHECVFPNPLFKSPCPPSLSLSHPLSCAHSLILSRGQNLAELLLQLGTLVLNLTQAARTVLLIQEASFPDCHRQERRGGMAVVHQAIHTLPKYGPSDLLSSHQGKKKLKKIGVLFDYCFEPVTSFRCIFSTKFQVVFPSDVYRCLYYTQLCWNSWALQED